MLYVLHGTDTEKAREKTRTLVASLTKREPNAAEFRLDAESCTPDALAEYLAAQGLFAARVLIILNRTFEGDETKELVLSRVKDIGGSPNIFILLEGALDKKTLGKLERYAEKIQEFKLTTKDLGLRTKDFNVFSLTDALGNHDGAKLWTLYQKALRAGISPEETHGVLFWQAKVLLQVTGGDTANLKPFVVGKAKRFLTHYSSEEARTLASRFVSLYHDARRGAVDFDLGLERLLLSLT